jgi:hypothetical protein
LEASFKGGQGSTSGCRAIEEEEEETETVKSGNGNLKKIKDIRLLEYLFSFYIIFFHILFSGIYLRQNIPITNGKELSPNVDKVMQNILMNYWEQ